MTTNHPAHGPVSLDRLHQISEILSKAAAQSDGGNLGYAMADAVKVIDELLQVRKAEPVAYMYKDKLHTDARFSLDTRFGNWSQEDINEYEITEIPLYTAPPAPVVPEEKRDEDGNTTSEFDHGRNSCRFAMLQAGNSPVTTDGWIPVSERMPEQYVEVMVCTDAGSRYIAALNRQMNWDDGDFFDDIQNVTHWMPLPAAPHFLEIENSSTKHFRENEETSTKCWCRTCRPVTFADSRFVVCPDCGNKRCPRANDHRNSCTGSNEPGQEGSAYPAAPQQEGKRNDAQP